MSGISTHVLDTARGRPASGLHVTLESQSGEGRWSVVGKGTTDADGRIARLLPAGAELHPGLYRLTFDTQSYFVAQEEEGFFPRVVVTFEVRDPTQHYHVPLLLSPFGYSAYRGS
ncbi:MAG TPA: hydroxyisourate hydrolase [Candidatus Xenobia bacterium]|nr:hydroxyisourate hydrolase [Candidatus Xenobia bacterium]